jgi:hypothetical protein
VGAVAFTGSSSGPGQRQRRHQAGRVEFGGGEHPVYRTEIAVPAAGLTGSCGPLAWPVFGVADDSLTG